MDYFRLLREGKVDEAMDIYWRITPARMAFEQQFGPTVRLGTYHWTQQKFYRWCTGGNGGITRQPALKLHDHEIAMTMNAFRAIGIEPPEDIDQFFTGRAASARGERVSAPAG